MTCSTTSAQHLASSKVVNQSVQQDTLPRLTPTGRRLHRDLN